MNGIRNICAGALLLCATGFSFPEKYPEYRVAGALYIEDEDFASNPFGFPMTVNELQKRYGNLFITGKELIDNIHEEDLTDTIYTFTYHQTSITVYKSAYQDILQSAVIRNKDIPLNRNIFIGMTKKVFSQSFHSLNENCPDYLEVGNAENTSVYAFTFKNERLHEVRYLGYVD